MTHPVPREEPVLDARILDRAGSVPAASWDSLAGDNPFVSHAFIAGLEQHGCLQPQLGWRPHHLALFDPDGRCAALAPGYLKGNSHGEFVFDHAWAEAYHRHGLDYFPKWLVASPYSPVPGARLLVGDAPGADARRRALADALLLMSRESRLSGIHINFASQADADVLSADERWLARSDWQFHWHNRDYRDFEHFLAGFSAKKRKNVRQERARVAASGLDIRLIAGGSANHAELDAMHDFYAITFQTKGNYPVLNRAFFGHLAEQFGDRLLIAMAFSDNQPVAGALFLRSPDALYGRYWGCELDLPGLHFELCYYRGIEYCIANGLQRFEPGAQGEHKLARGFEPVTTRSFHHLHHPQMQQAVSQWLADEARWVKSYGEQLRQHLPFKSPDGVS